LREHGLDRLTALRGAATPQAVAFFRTYDLAFRIRRLRLLARRLARDWTDLEDTDAAQAREAARTAVFAALAPYIALEPVESLGEDFAELAAGALDDAGPVLEAIAVRRQLAETDLRVDAILAEAMAAMPKVLRRRTLMAYLGFPFYDTATLPLHNGDGLNEFDPIKVDRISPEDCRAIRAGGAESTLRGREFFSFGAFFSRAYRENDYLWGRLHGAERMVDLLASGSEQPLDEATLREFKRDAFLAILEEERDRLVAEPGLVDGLVAEVEAAIAQASSEQQPTAVAPAQAGAHPPPPDGVSVEQ
jgi:patatin-related protein